MKRSFIIHLNDLSNGGQLNGMGQLSGGNLHRGLLPSGDCLGGNWHGEIIAKGGLSQGLLVGGNCPGGNFPVPIKYAACLKSSLTFDKSIKE